MKLVAIYFLRRNVILFFFLATLTRGLPCYGYPPSDSLASNYTLHYYFSISSGVLIGSKSESFENSKSVTFSTTHGIAINKTRFGIGIGVDGYNGKDVFPVFASISREVLGKRNKLVAEINVGSALVRSLRNETYQQVESSGGLMVSPLVGYQLHSGSLSVAVMVGYKFQRLVDECSYSFNGQGINSFNYNYAYEDRLQTDLNRMLIAIRIGFR